MERQIRVRTAQILGRSHLLSGRNSQDALKTGSLEVRGQKVFYGVICDGCSEGESSEVGAKLAATFLGRQIEILVKSNVPLSKIPPILHKRMLGFLKGLLGRISFDSQTSRVTFIESNLLFTILGFVYTDDETIVFAQGDGVLVVNGEVTVRDENNRPNYIGYGLVPSQPTAFDVYLFPGALISRLAISSDALGEELGFVNELWDNAHPLGLQRKVNILSRDEHRFRDDLSVIALEVTYDASDSGR